MFSVLTTKKTVNVLSQNINLLRITTNLISILKMYNSKAIEYIDIILFAYLIMYLFYYQFT